MEIGEREKSRLGSNYLIRSIEIRTGGLFHDVIYTWYQDCSATLQRDYLRERMWSMRLPATFHSPRPTVSITRKL